MGMKVIGLLIMTLWFTSCSDVNDTNDRYYYVASPAGRLKSLLTDTLAEGLRLSGKVSDEDFRYIRENFHWLKELDLKETDVVELPDFRLADSRSLEKVKLPKGIKRLESPIFKNCDKLVEVEMPEGLLEIGDEVLMGTLVREIIFPQSVVRIGKRVAMLCNELEKIELPINYQDTLDNVAVNCPKLKYLEIPAGTKYCSWDIVWYGGEQTLLDINVDTLKLLNPIPPEASIRLSEQQKEETVLIVPEGSGEAYAGSPDSGWGQFRKIIETEK